VASIAVQLFDSAKTAELWCLLKKKRAFKIRRMSHDMEISSLLMIIIFTLTTLLATSLLDSTKEK
jgi:hypothetical protein